MKDSTIVMLAEKVEKAVVALGNGVGKTADYVYPVLVKQQVMKPIALFAALLFCLVPTLLLFRICNKEGSWEDPSFKQLLCTIAMCIGAVLSLIILIMFLIELPGLFNPEYYALREIIELVKPGK